MEYTENNPLRVFTSFSGYDSQSMALDRLKEMHPVVRLRACRMV